MAQIDPPAAVPPGSVPPGTPPSAGPRPRGRRSRLRTLLLIVVVLIVAAVVLVALAPTLLGTRPAVNIALGQVNKRLNGHVEVASASLGWTTGVRLDGVRVFDDAGAQIAQADHIVCPMPLWHAVTGSYPLGNTVIDGLAFDAKYDDQGRLNFAQLVKTNPSAAKPGESHPAEPGKPSKLPDVSGDVQLTNARGTISQPGKPTVFLTALAGEVKIPNINAPITDHLAATAHVGDGGPEGHLVADGTAAAIKANQLDLDTADVHQTADVTNLDLAAAKPFVPATLGLDTLAGLLGAHLALDVTGGKSATLDATATAKQKIAIGGRLLKGDTYTTNTFDAAVPKLAATFPEGLGHWQSGRVKVGADAGSVPISLKVDQGQLTLVLDVVPQAVLNLKDSHAPGSAGRVEFADHFDAGQIVTQLKNSAHLAGDATLTSGTLDQSVKLTLTPDRGTLATTADLANVAGTRDGKPVAIQPIHLAIAGADIGGGTLLDGLRDLDLKLSSKFANGDFHGTTVGDLTGTLTAQLQALQAEAGQLVDFGKTKLGGDLVLHIADSGQLLQAPYQAKVKADATVTNLQYAGTSGPEVAEPLVQLNVTGDLQGTATAAVESVRNLLLTLKAGTAAAPTVDLAAIVPTATLQPELAADFRVTQLDVNLPQAQQQFYNLPAGQAGPICSGGTATGTAAGHYTKAGVRLDSFALSLARLFVQKQLVTGQRVNAIADDTVNISAVGTVGLGETKTVQLADLSVADTAKIIDVHKGTGELVLTKGADTASGRGQLAVVAELGSLNDIVRALMQTTVAVATPGGRITSGHLSGTLAFNAAAGGKTDVVGNFDVPNLDVTTATGGTGPQKATILLRGSSDDATHTIVIDEASFKSPFATAAITNGTVLLNAPSTLDELQKASVAVDVSDLKTLAALMQSFAAPPPAAEPPLRFTAGSLSVKADVSHDGNNLAINVPTLAANNVAFTRGPASYQAKPITAQLAATVGTAAGATVMKQLRGLKVTKLDATTGVATVSLTTPITVADLSNPAASAAGGIQVVGELADLSQLLAAFEGKPADAYPYRGQYTLTQNLTGGQTVALKGGLNVAHFQVMQGQTAQFTEDQLNVANDVSLAADYNSVYLHALTVAMQSSGALNVAVTEGTVIDLAKTRQLHLPVQLQYDLAKLWPIVHPMLLTPGQPDKYKDLKIAGAFKKSLLIDGAYPTGVPATEAVKQLRVDADLAVASFEDNGLIVKDLDVPVTVRNGKAVTAKPDGTTAPVATANDGQLDLGNCTVDLTQTPYRLTTPAKKAVLAKVSINPLFSQTFLAKVVNNPVFAGAEQATGLLDLTLDRCTDLPLGDLVTQAVPANTGVANVRFSLTNLHIGLQGLGALGSALKQDSFEAHVDDATVAIARGVSTQHVKFVTGTYAVAFDGSVRLADEAFTPMTISVPMAVILDKGGVHDPAVLKYVPDQVGLPLRGTVHHPELSLGEAIANAGRDAALKAAAGGILGGGKSGGGSNPADAIGGLLNGLGRKHH